MRGYSIIVLLILGLSCATANKSLISDNRYPRADYSDGTIKIFPFAVMLRLPPDCQAVRIKSYQTLPSIKASIRNDPGSSRPIYGLNKRVATNSEYLFLLKGCEYDSLSIYITPATENDIAFRLREYVPSTMRLHHFSIGDPTEPKYELKFSRLAGWSVASFPFGIDFGDGDGSIMQAYYCYRRCGDSTILLVFVIDAVTTGNYQQNLKIVLESYANGN